MTIATLETQLTDLNNCTKNLKDERSRNDKNKNDFDKVNKDFEALSAESLKVRQGLDKCQNDLNNVQKDFNALRTGNDGTISQLNNFQSQISTCNNNLASAQQ